VARQPREGKNLRSVPPPISFLLRNGNAYPRCCLPVSHAPFRMTHRQPMNFIVQMKANQLSRPAWLDPFAPSALRSLSWGSLLVRKQLGSIL
jgi:hypothetical protein